MLIICHCWKRFTYVNLHFIPTLCSEDYEYLLLLHMEEIEAQSIRSHSKWQSCPNSAFVSCSEEAFFCILVCSQHSDQSACVISLIVPFLSPKPPGGNLFSGSALQSPTHPPPWHQHLLFPPHWYLFFFLAPSCFICLEPLPRQSSGSLPHLLSVFTQMSLLREASLITWFKTSTHLHFPWQLLSFHDNSLLTCSVTGLTIVEPTSPFFACSFHRSDNYAAFSTVPGP